MVTPTTHTPYQQLVWGHYCTHHFSLALSMLTSPPSVTSSGRGALPSDVIQTGIPEGSMPSGTTLSQARVAVLVQSQSQTAK